MGEYLRSIGLYSAMFVMVFTLAGFIFYYTDVSSLKQDTYKEFMYSSLNKSTIRLEGLSGLYNGDINSYYLDENGDYSQLNDEIVKQIGLTSKSSGKVSYELLYDQAANEYFLHLKTSDVDSVVKFKLEKGDE